VLGPSYLFATGYWADPSYDLAAAQNAGVELTCRRLALEPGGRLLDVDCGWGSFLLRAVRSYDVSAVGATLSEEQAEVARRRVSEAGLGDRIRIHHGDWRELDGAPFDAITGSGLGDYVAAEGFGTHASALAERLGPDGRLVLDQVSRRQEAVTTERSFIDAYVSPGAELPRLADLVGALEAAGFEVREVESLREHQARTLRAWLDNLEAAWACAPASMPTSRLRVWQLYLAVSALAFEAGRIGVHQVLAVRQPTTPLT
jgi:cyclopropane-fatty-acyl-phospholipid synthase